MDKSIPRESLLRWLFPGCFKEPGRGDPHAEHEKSFVHEFLHHVPVVFVLVGIAVIVHHYHWFGGLTAQTMRLVYWVERNAPGLNWAEREIERQAKANEPDRPVLTLLRFTPKGFQSEFCGLSPVPRNRMAAVMEALAPALPTAKAGAARPVIGIDIDITSLRGSPSSAVNLTCRAEDAPLPSQSCPGDAADCRILNAMEHLADKANVVVIAFPRLAAEARKVRNESMRKLCEHVRFASAQVFIDPGEPFYRFLDKRKEGPKSDWSTQPNARHQLPPYFPSLGNLMSLSLGTNPRGSGLTNGQPSESARYTALGALCEAAKSPLPQELLLAVGDMPELASYGTASFKPEELYEWSYLDLLRGGVRVHLEPVDDIPAMADAVRKAIEEWGRRPGTAAPMFIVAIDDGYTDKYFTVQNDYVSGDSIHGLTAFSQRHPVRHCSQWNALFDLVLGCLYVAAWVPILLCVRWLRPDAPSAATAMAVMLPAVFAICFMIVTIYISAWRLQEGAWIDPLLVMLGLTIHAYATLGHEMARTTGAQEAGKGIRIEEGVKSTGIENLLLQVKERLRWLDPHLACGGSLLLRTSGLAIVIWAAVLIMKSTHPCGALG